MYKSPIEMMLGSIQMQQDGEIYRAVQNIGISVDKEELVKALRYDREQYDKGYKDGVKALAEQLKERYAEYYCGYTSAYIDVVAKEMLEGKDGNQRNKDDS